MAPTFPAKKFRSKWELVEFLVMAFKWRRPGLCLVLRTGGGLWTIHAGLILTAFTIDGGYAMLGKTSASCVV